MKTKLLDILICMLLIAATVIPAAGMTNDDKSFREISGDYRNSVQKIIDTCLTMTGWSQQALLENLYHCQSFLRCICC